jgi:hypothetical protein
VVKLTAVLIGIVRRLLAKRQSILINNNTEECGLILILIIEESKYAIHAPYHVLYLNLFYFYHTIRKLQLNDAFEPPPPTQTLTRVTLETCTNPRRKFGGTQA